MNAPGATGLSLLATDLTHPEALLTGWPFAVVPSSGTDSPIRATATLPASIQSMANLPAIPSVNSSTHSRSLGVSPFNIRQSDLPTMAAMGSEATSYVANFLSGTSSDPGSSSSSPPLTTRATRNPTE